MNTLNIFLCSCKAGQKKLGTEYAPITLLSKFDNIISRNNFEFMINNNIIVKKTFINSVEFDEGNGYQTLYDSGLGNYTNILNLGGDHSIGISTVLSSLYNYGKKLKVIWVDAHADLNTFDSSVTKNTHGMPLSPAFRLMKPWLDIKEDQYYMDPSQLVYIGLRSIDPSEKKFIDELGIKVYYAKDVFEKGIEKIMEEIIGKDNSIYHLSFDIDGLDPLYMPSTGTIEGNGLALDDGKYIIKSLMGTKRMKVFDLVELNLNIGELDDQLKTANNCAILLEEYVNGLSSS